MDDAHGGSSEEQGGPGYHPRNGAEILRDYLNLPVDFIWESLEPKG
jgi:hypothetical protein